MNHPLISVVTVVYNAVAAIENTMQSVLEQTYNNVEYIVIDGGSTDGTVEVIKKYSSRLAYWVSEPDKGIYDAMNKGIRKAHGEWINFMNAGDSFYAPDVLSKVFGEGKYNADYMVGVANCSIGTYWKPVRTEFTYREVCAGGGVNHQASFIRLSLFSDDCYQIKYKIIADELFFVQKVVFEGCSYVCLPFIICNYDSNGISSNASSMIVKQERADFIKEYLPARLLADYRETDKMALKRLLCKTLWYVPKRILPKKILRMIYDLDIQWFVNLPK